MGFTINRNISALVAMGGIGKHQRDLTRSIERLSTGLRINRGADDPAALGVSENLRAQIAGLNRAISNAQEGISVMQTADGALSEITSLITRSRELAVQSQSATLTTSDRLELQEEVDQLVAEIDRIASSTEFNSKSLLNGNATARLTSNNSDLNLIAREDIQAGRYDVQLSQTDAGEGQIQKSGILALRTSGNNAAAADTIGSLSVSYNNAGINLLSTPATISIRGNGASADVTVTSSQSIQDFAQAVESAITSSKESGGLGIEGSTFAFDSANSQLVFEAGLAGIPGEVSFASNNSDFLENLAFSIVSESSAKSFRITASQLDVTDPRSGQTTTNFNRAYQVIPGLEFSFDAPTEARISGTVGGVDAVNVSTTAGDIVFTIHDTNATDNNQATSSISAGVEVTLTAGRTYTTASIADIVNTAVSVSNDENHAVTTGFATSESYTTPGITASVDGKNLVLSSTITGSSGAISIVANQAAADILGLNSGRFLGSGGSAAILSGNVNIASGVTFAGSGVTRLRVGDGNFGIDSSNLANGSTSTNITFNQGTTITQSSILTGFNNYFTANNINATASVNGSGYLVLTSGVTGTDAKISIAETSGATLSTLGLTSGSNATGSGGNTATITGATNNGAQTTGFTLSSYVRFSATDSRGVQTSTVYLGTSNTSNNESFAISKEAITSLFNTANFSSTDVNFRFDGANRLVFQTATAGASSSIRLSTTGSSDVSAGLNGFGIDLSQSDQGSGLTRFQIQVKDSRLSFQVGANAGQSVQLGIGNTTAEGLGLTGLDVSTQNAANRSLLTLDEALSRVNRERIKVGAMQNRLSSTVNSLTTTSLNTTAAESTIRDTDVAQETVNYTRSQLLLQSAVAQLTQANTAGDIALTLFA